MAKSIRIQTLLVISIAIIYLVTLTSDYYWDGITFALQIEKVASGERGASLLFHQNHLLYNAFGYLLYRAAHAIGLTTRALLLLQVTNTFIGALAVGVFFRIAERTLRNRYIAVVCAAGFAVSAVWWKLATDADAYVLSILLILICISNLVSAKPRWYVAGLALASAMLVHQLASLIYPATVVAVFRNEAIEDKGRFAIRVSSIAWLLTISVYYLCAVLLHGINKPLDVLKWATSNPSGVTPSLNPAQGVLLIPSSNLDSIVGHRFRLFVSHTGAVELLFGLAALIALITLTVLLIRVAQRIDFRQMYRSVRSATPQMSGTWRQIAPVLITWIGTYMVFLIFWEPWQLYYRAFYIPALAMLFGLVLNNYHSVTGNKPCGVAALIVVTTMLMNLAFYIGPLLRTNSNELIAEARSANRSWDENTIIYFADRKEADTTFEYFNEKTQWRRLTAEAQLKLGSEIERIYKEGGSIWLNKGAAESVDQTWLARHARGGRIDVKIPGGIAHYVELLRGE